ncbi:MAG: ribonuclease P protein component [Patescibacteria group bacterium]
MLPRLHRLRKTDIGAVITSGRTYQSPGLNLKIRSGDQSLSFAIVVSNKVANLASDRNKLKRQIRYIINKNLGLMNRGFQGVFFAKNSLKTTLFKDLEKDIVYLLKSAGVIR